MQEMALDLSPTIKYEFKNLSHYLGLDKSTQMRACYLFEEFIKKSQQPILKDQQSVFLRVATFIGCKSMTYKNKEGKQVQGIQVYANSFLKEANFGLDIFLKSIKEFKQVVFLESFIEKELDLILSQFSFYENIFLKYDRCIENLEISSHMIRKDKLYNNRKIIKQSYWLLFIVAHRDLLNSTQNIYQTILLLGSIFIEMLNDEEIISNYIINMTQENEVSNYQVQQYLCNFLKIKSIKEFNDMQEKLNVLIDSLMSKNIFNRDKNHPQRLNFILRSLDYHYQKNLKFENIDLRFFIQKTKSSKRTKDFSPIQKQAYVNKKSYFNLPNKKLSSQRILSYDNYNSNIEQPKESQQIKAPINFAKMYQSPYQQKKVVQATPMTTAMELYYWLEEKCQQCQIFNEDEIDQQIVKEAKGLQFFWEQLDEDSFEILIQQNLIENTVKVLKKTFKNENSSKEFIERKDMILNFTFSILNDFILREKQITDLQTHIVSSDFITTLLVCSIETVYFILNDTSFDITKLLNCLEFSAFTFYRSNFFILNYENYIITPLKKHFLDIETYLLSHLIWCDKIFILMKIEENPEMSEVFNRLFHYMSSQIQKLTLALHLESSMSEKIWNFFKKIFLFHREIFHNRFLEQIIMCSIYAICKVSSVKKLKFQNIFTQYQEISSFSKYIFHNIVFKCRISDDEANDIIHFYNQVYVPQLKDLIIETGKTFTFEDLKDSKYSSVITQNFHKENLQVINSPLRQLVSTPFTYHNKNLSSFSSFQSPTNQMFGIQPPLMKSKKLLNFTKQEQQKKVQVIDIEEEDLDLIKRKLDRFKQLIMNNQKFQEINSFYDSYEIQGKQHNSLWQDFLLCRNPQTQQSIVKLIKKFKKINELKNALNEVQFFKDIQSPYVLNLLDYSMQKKSQFCSGTHYILTLYIEYEPQSLKQFYSEQLEKKLFFSQKQITDLFYQVILACSEVEKHHQKEFKISDEVIFLNSKGQFKIGFNIQDQEDKITKSYCTEFFQSPQEYYYHQHNKVGVREYDFSKSEVFALGLVILKMGLLKSVQKIYKQDGSICEQTLQNLMQSFTYKYHHNTLLVTSISKMLEIYEENRPSFTDLKNALPYYELVQEYFKDQNLDIDNEIQGNQFEFIQKNGDNIIDKQNDNFSQIVKEQYNIPGFTHSLHSQQIINE